MQCSDLQRPLVNKLMEMMPGIVTEEAAKTLTESAITEMLFSPTKIKNPNRRYNGDPDYVMDGPTVIQQIAKELIEPLMREALIKWVKDNHDAILKTIHVQVGDEGENLMVMALGGLFRNAWTRTQSEIREAIINPAAYMSKPNPPY